MKRTCICCGCLCLTGLRIAGRMICLGCESSLVHSRCSLPDSSLLALYQPDSSFRPAGDGTAT